jgi:uncharacterized protein (DUF885 family)
VLFHRQSRSFTTNLTRARAIGWAFFFALAAAACAHQPAGAGVGAGATATGSATTDAAALNRLFDDYYEESLALDPVLATTLGDHRYDDHLAVEISEPYRASVAEMSRRFLARLAAFAPAALAPDDRLSHELLRRELAERLESLSFPEHLLALTHISGQPVDFPVLGSGGGVHPFTSAADYDHFLRRMDDFVTWVDTAIANMRRGIATGVVHPRVVVERLIPQLDAQVVDDPDKSIFFEPLRRPPATLSAADRARLEAAYRTAIRERLVPSYRRLRAFLADDYLPHCRTSISIESLPNGRAWYAFRVRTSITTRLTPDEIFKLGESEVARIEQEMQRLRDASGSKSDLATFARALARAPGGLNTREAVVAAYQSLRAKVSAALPGLFGRLPRAPFEIRAIEPFREASAPSQYQPASPDGTRPGVFYVNTADIAKGLSMRVSETLFLHEALPGHHLQLSLQYEDNTLPRFRRLLGYTAFVEGWGLYAESLGDEIGVYREPAQAIEHLGAEILRAVRLVVDTGLHHRGWTREQAIEYFKAHVISTSSDVALNAVREVERYIAWPGQALAYKVGQLKIAELRARATRALGPRFDLRAFHDEVLGNGPLPLDLLEARIDQWIASRRG